MRASERNEKNNGSAANHKDTNLSSASIFSSKKKNSYLNTQTKEEIFNQAINFHLHGNILEAGKYYKYLIDQEEADPRVLSNYGLLLKDLGKLKEAEAFQRKAIKIKPDFANAYANLGNLLIELEELEKAEEYTRQAIDLKYNLETAHYNLATILMKLGKPEEAEASQREAIKLKPNFAKAHSNLGEILWDLGKLKEAEISQRKAIELQPDLAEAYLILGEIFKDLGKLKEAKILIKKSIKIKPNFSKAYFSLSLIINPEPKDNLIEYLFSKEIFKNYENLCSIDIADIYYARGNILEKRKEYKDSYRMFRIANIITRKVYKSNFKVYQKLLKQNNLILKKIKENSKLQINHEELPTPIFIAGLPRAGKSTIESILSNNNLLIKFGDRKGISEAITNYNNIDKCLQQLGLNIHSKAKEIRDKYISLAKVNHPDKGGDRETMSEISIAYKFLIKEYKGKEKDYIRPSLFKYFIDKLGTDLDSKFFTSHTSPNNILYLGLIISKIPRSKIIYCYRNHKDHIIELYKYNIKNYLTLRTSTFELAKIIVQIDNIMEEYKNRYSSQIYFLNFDHLIQEPEIEIRSLLNWLGWVYDDKYLTPRLRQKGVIKSIHDINNLNSSYINTHINYIEELKGIEGILSKSKRYNY